MKLNLTLKNVIAFLAIVFVFHELHELAHTAVGRVACDCWGPRDFNAWNVCPTCPSSFNTLWATLAGPVFTYALIWLGYLMMSKKNLLGTQVLGWVFVFANKPFARIFTVLVKGGDESVLMKGISGTNRLSILLWIVEIAVVLALTVPPLIRAYRLVVKNKVAVLVSFLLVPMLLEFTFMHKLGNYLLSNGVLSKTGLFGSPVLINVWFFSWVILLLFTATSLKKILVPKSKVVNQIFEEDSIAIL